MSDTAIKALTGITGAHGGMGLVLSPWLAVARDGLGRRLLRLRPRASRAARPCPVIAVTGTAANIAGIAGGILVFGDPMAGSAGGNRAAGRLHSCS